jgi:hypothetical protein
MSSPPPSDSLRNSALWISVTVRVAWEFVNAGIRLGPAALDEAREHVLRSIPANCTDSDRAELLARAFANEYLDRVRSREYRRVAELEDIDISVPRGWARQLEESATQVEEAVYRLHYGDGLSLDEIQRRYSTLDMSRLIAAREGIRELARSYAQADGHISQSWSEGRLDRLLTRVASRPKGSCPRPRALMEPTGLQHADQCPACSRAVRLIRAGILTVDDLEPQESSFPDMHTPVGVFALLLHPDARRHRKRLVKSMGPVANAVGTDTWLIAESDIGDILPVLSDLCEEGTPHRHHLRGALVRGPGRWSRGVFLGGLAVDALEAARARTWANMGAVCRLPKALPPPPKATIWWSAAAMSGLMCIGTWLWFSQDTPDPPETPVSAEFSQVDQGWKLRFDTPDLAVIDVVVLSGGQLRVHRNGVKAGKGAWSTGEGDYEVYLPGSQAMIISSPEGIDGLSDLVIASADRRDPFEDLAEEVADRFPGASFEVSPHADSESSTQSAGVLQ